ncbi:MAG TPA: hypothetical protein VG013_24765 [Gemmataceae bacterium]|jgi:hypothetical protein|nr:hypothetical protein [Gemmataceae bacterium]
MRCCRVVLLLLAALGSACPHAPAAAEKAATDPVNRLIAQLGSHKFAEREAATQALDAVGGPALQPLTKAARDQDPEVRRRARELTRRIEKRIETEQLLAGQRVRLVYKNVPIAEAVADLKKKTGLNVELAGDRSQLTSRKVTLDTGDTTVWQAYEQFCEKAGVGEPGPAPHPSRVASNVDDLRRMQIQEEIMMLRMQGRYGYSRQPQTDGRMVLADGKAHALPTSLAGAVRIRALAPHTGVDGQPTEPGEKILALEITPEPKMQWQGIINVRVDKAVDDKGQSLPQSAGPEVGMMNLYSPKAMIFMDDSGSIVTNPRHLPIRFKAAKQPSKVLKELKGTVAAQVQTPTQPLLTVDNILNRRAKKDVKDNDGDSLKVLDVDCQKDGMVKLHVQLTSSSGNGMWNGNRVIFRRRLIRGGGGRVIVQEESSGGSSLALKDAKGRDLKLVNTQYVQIMRAFNGFTQEVELTYQAHKGQDPAKFVYSGPRTVIVDVPFTLKNVPLP